MGVREFTTLCTLTLALASCSVKSGEQEIARDIPKQLACAASTVDESVNIHQPYLGRGDYGFSGGFDDLDGIQRHFYLRHPEGTNRLETEFYDDDGNINISHVYSYTRGDGIEFSRDTWSSSLRKSVKPSSIDKSKWEETYERFLKWAYDKIKKTCDENPFASEIDSIGDYDAIVSRTTKPTIVEFSAKWCAPCRYFENYMLRPFWRKNHENFNLIRINAGGEQPFSIGDGWEEFLDKRYRIKSFGFPLVVFLDQNHQFKGSHTTGWDDGFYEGVEKYFGEFKRY